MFLRFWHLKKKIELKSEEGFSLIETIMAIAIVSISVIPLFLVLSSLVQDAAINEFGEVAAGLAEQEIEKIIAGRFDEPATAGAAAYTGTYSDYTYAFTVTDIGAGNDSALNTNCGGSTCQSIDITVTHTPTGMAATARTYKASV